MKGTDKTFHCTYIAHVPHLMSNGSGTDEEQLQCFWIQYKSACFATLLHLHLKQN